MDEKPKEKVEQKVPLIRNILFAGLILLIMYGILIIMVNVLPWTKPTPETNPGTTIPLVYSKTMVALFKYNHTTHPDLLAYSNNLLVPIKVAVTNETNISYAYLGSYIINSNTSITLQLIKGTCAMGQERNITKWKNSLSAEEAQEKINSCIVDDPTIQVLIIPNDDFLTLLHDMGVPYDDEVQKDIDAKKNQTDIETDSQNLNRQPTL
jgi:hypothetical protein